MSANWVATRDSWKTLPLPTKRAHFQMSLSFSNAEGDRLRSGFIPACMEDKWFIFFEDGWLYFHRSWTGYCLFGVRVDESSNGVRLAEAWASRDPSQYASDNIDFDKGMLETLIRNRLLRYTPNANLE